jgi:hypothetical protein
MYQVTTGCSGYELYSICQPRNIPGKFMFAQNIYWGWTQVRATSESITLFSQGVNNPQMAPLPLY